MVLFVLVVAASLWTDEAFGIPELLPGPLGAAIGVTLLALGLPLWAPLHMVANLVEITRVEQPELERRLGAPYDEYLRRVPMIVPSRNRSRHVGDAVRTRRPT